MKTEVPGLDRPMLAEPRLREEWRMIDGFPLYDVSNWGRVRSCVRKGQYEGPRQRNDHPLILRPGTSGTNKDKIHLCVFLHGEAFKIHVLVLEAFRGKRPEGLVGRHLDDCSINNYLENLEWGTQKQNSQDSIRNGTRADCGGENNGRAILNEELVREIRDRARNGEGKSKMAREFGLSPGAICRGVNRQSWGHIE